MVQIRLTGCSGVESYYASDCQIHNWKQRCERPRCERPRFGQSPFATFLHESTHPEKNMAALVTSTLHLPQANPKNKIPYTLNSITENRKNQKNKKNKKKPKIPEKGWGAHSCWIFGFFFFLVFCVFLVVLLIVPPVYRGGFTLKMFSPYFLNSKA